MLVRKGCIANPMDLVHSNLEDELDYLAPLRLQAEKCLHISGYN